MDEKEMLDKLAQFTQKIHQVEETAPAVEEEQKEEEEVKEEEKKQKLSDGEEVLSGEDEQVKNDTWLSHKLKFKKENKLKDIYSDASERYKTFDPLKFANVKPLSQHQRRLKGDKNLEEW